ncbi:MAG: hypothetical protein Q9227_006079 [Pyrenula ochraceoflavens]
MTFPTRSLGRLSIDPGRSTRSHTPQTQEGETRLSPLANRLGMEEETEEALPPLRMLGTSGLTYDLTGLSLLSRRRAASTSTEAIPLTPSGPSPTVENLYDFLSTTVVDRLTFNLGWPSPTSQSSQSAPNTRAPTPPRAISAMRARDLLSTFHRNVLPTDHLISEYGNIDRPRVPEECNVPLDLEATIFRLSVNEPAVLEALERVQPPAACAEIFYDKLTRNISVAMNQYDNVVSEAATATGLCRNILPVTLAIARTTSTIRDTVREIRGNLRLRKPYGRLPALDRLLYILDAVLDRNLTFFTEVPGLVPQEPLGKRNLWVSCALSERYRPPPPPAPPSQAQEQETERFFVLDALTEIPLKTLHTRIMELNRVRERVRDAGMGGMDPEYMDAMDTLMRRATAMSEGSEQEQRPGLSTPMPTIAPSMGRGREASAASSTRGRGGPAPGGESLSATATATATPPATTTTTGRGRARGRGGRAGAKRPASAGSSAAAESSTRGRGPRGGGKRPR